MVVVWYLFVVRLVERVSLVVAASRMIRNSFGTRCGCCLWWLTAPVSARRASWLDYTASEDCICGISGSVDGDTAPEDGIPSIELYCIAPIVV